MDRRREDESSEVPSHIPTARRIEQSPPDAYHYDFTPALSGAAANAILANMDARFLGRQGIGFLAQESSYRDGGSGPSSTVLSIKKGADRKLVDRFIARVNNSNIAAIHIDTRLFPDYEEQDPRIKVILEPGEKRPVFSVACDPQTNKVLSGGFRRQNGEIISIPEVVGMDFADAIMKLFNPDRFLLIKRKGVDA